MMTEKALTSEPRKVARMRAETEWHWLCPRCEKEVVKGYRPSKGNLLCGECWWKGMAEERWSRLLEECPGVVGAEVVEGIFAESELRGLVLKTKGGLELHVKVEDHYEDRGTLSITRKEAG